MTKVATLGLGLFRIEDAPEGETLTAKQIAAAYLVSERTARRHLAKGTLPDTRRRAGRDRKTYPGGARHARAPPRPEPKRDLTMARNAIRRAARAGMFTSVDCAVMEVIAAEAAAALAEWRINIERAGSSWENGAAWGG